MSVPPKIVILFKVKRSCKCKHGKKSESYIAPELASPEQAATETQISPHRELRSTAAPELASPEQAAKETQISPHRELRSTAAVLNAKVLKDIELESTEELKPRPVELTYSMKNRTEPSPVEPITKTSVEDKVEACFMCFKKHKSKGYTSSEHTEETLAIRPSQLEFNFEIEPTAGQLGHHSHVRASVFQKLSWIPNKLYNVMGCSHCEINHETDLAFGERGSGFKTKGESQIFYKLRYNCLAEKTLFEDPEFPAVPTSISCCGTDPTLKQIAPALVWRRPNEIVENPRLYVNGHSRFDVKQGILGDCWLLAALASLTVYIKLFAQILPQDQGFDSTYAGIFHFRFWQYGRWIDVVVDDRIPTVPDGRMVFVQSADEREFWSALVEKAYAKLYGSYEALIGGTGREAMLNLTGGFCELFPIHKTVPENFFKILLKAYERSALMTCCIRSDPKVHEAVTPEGLVRGHEFSITKVTRVMLMNHKQVDLIRLRNPWGGDTEWNGAWSDNSPEWTSTLPKERQRLGLVFKDDGEFWMTYDDFIKYFEFVTICNLNPDCLLYESIVNNSKKWEMSMYEGQWVCGVTAGGSYNYDTFYCNPQYRVTLTEVDDDDNKCTLLVSLMLKHLRRLKVEGKNARIGVGIEIIFLPEPENAPVPLDQDFLSRNNPLTLPEHRYQITAENISRVKLDPGTYVVVPATWAPDTANEYLLRIFTEKRNILTEHDNETLSYSAATYLLQKPDKMPEYEVHDLFRNISGEDGEVDWRELKEILDFVLSKETKGREFSADACRSMIAMMDTDFTGKLNYIEFKKLWNGIMHWKDVFFKFDKDQSGTFSGFELRNALEAAGFKLNFHILNKLMLRYGNKRGELNFEDFIICAVKVKTLIDLFEYKARDNRVMLEMEEWMDLTVSAT